MSPWELESLINGVMQDLRSTVAPDAPHLPKLEAALSQFMRQWQGVHARHGEDEAGDPAYKQALEQLVAQAAMFAGAWKLPNGMDAAELLYQSVVLGALKDGDGKPVLILPPGAKQRAGPGSPGSARPRRQRGRQKPAPRAPEMPSQAAAPPSTPGQPQRAPAPVQARTPNQAAGPAGNGQAKPNAPIDPANSPLRSVHTKSLPELLRQAASSLLVSTYQAGKLVILREDQGKLNTHFRLYKSSHGHGLRPGPAVPGTAIFRRALSQHAGSGPKARSARQARQRVSPQAGPHYRQYRYP